MPSSRIFQRLEEQWCTHIGPIFIVGLPRSRTSSSRGSLNRTLGSSPLEELNWMADFGLDIAVGFKKWSRRAGDPSFP
jgi:hypothetical protein